jgi:hypothetical protein
MLIDPTKGKRAISAPTDEKRSVGLTQLLAQTAPGAQRQQQRQHGFHAALQLQMCCSSTAAEAYMTEAWCGCLLLASLWQQYMPCSMLRVLAMALPDTHPSWEKHYAMADFMGSNMKSAMASVLLCCAC